jgi:23S rRNA pseudouridine1911/1915/1917 synthase
MKKVILDVLHHDEDVVVVNKPAGLLSIPDRFDGSLPDVRSMVRSRFGEAFVVHRLDRDTSGIIMFALNAEAHRSMSMQFEHHTVNKLYHAVVSGTVERDSFAIDIPLMADAKRKGLVRPSARGKEARTEIRVLERFRIASLIEAKLITGRQHQIRVHCSAVGHPLLVDADYGRATQFLLSSIKRKFKLAKDTEERPIIARQTLHAYELGIVHPRTSQPISWVAPHPKDFAATLQVLRKYAAPYASTFDVEFF